MAFCFECRNRREPEARRQLGDREMAEHKLAVHADILSPANVVWWREELARAVARESR